MIRYNLQETEPVSETVTTEETPAEETPKEETSEESGTV